MKTKLTTLFATFLIATSLNAASDEKANEYHDTLMEVLDIQSISKETAEIVISEYANMGMTFEGDNLDKALALLTDVYVETFPEIFESQIPLYAEIYTDEELDYMIAQLETPVGISVVQKSTVFGAKSGAESSKTIMPKIMAIMPEIQALTTQ